MFKFEDPFASPSECLEHRSSQHSVLASLRGSIDLIDPPKPDRVLPREAYYSLGLIEGAQRVKHALVKVEEDCALISFAISDSPSWRGRIDQDRYRVPDAMAQVIRLKSKGWIELISAYGVAMDKSRITTIMSAERGEDSFSVVIDPKGTLKPLWCRLCCTEHAKMANSVLQRMIWKKRMGNIDLSSFEDVAQFEVIVIHYGIIQAQIFNQQGSFRKSVKPAMSSNLEYFQALITEGQILLFDKRCKYEEMLSSANALIVFPLCKGTVFSQGTEAPLEIEIVNKAFQMKLLLRSSNIEETKLWMDALEVDKSLRKMSASDDFSSSGMNFEYARSRKVSRASLSSSLKLSEVSEGKTTNSSVVPVEKLPIGLTTPLHSLSSSHVVLRELEAKGFQPPVFKTRYVRVSFAGDIISADSKIECFIEYLSESNDVLSKIAITSNFSTESFQEWPEALVIRPNKSVHLPICAFFCCSFHKDQVKIFIELIVVALKQENSESRLKLVSKVQHSSKIIQSGQVLLTCPKYSGKISHRTVYLHLFNGRLIFWDHSKGHPGGNTLNVVTFCEGTRFKFNFESLRFLIYQEKEFIYLFSCLNELFFKDWIERISQQIEGQSLNVDEFDMLCLDRDIYPNDSKYDLPKFSSLLETCNFLTLNALNWKILPALKPSFPDLNSFVAVNRSGKKIFKTISATGSSLKVAQFTSGTENISDFEKTLSSELEIVPLSVTDQSDLELSHTNPLELVHLERGRFGPQYSLELCCSYHAKYALTLHRDFKGVQLNPSLDTSRLCIMFGEIDFKQVNKKSSWRTKQAYLVDGLIYCVDNYKNIAAASNKLVDLIDGSIHSLDKYKNMPNSRAQDIIPLCCGSTISADLFDESFTMKHPSGLEWQFRFESLSLRNRWLAAIEIDSSLRGVSSLLEDPQVLHNNNIGSLKSLKMNEANGNASVLTIHDMLFRFKILCKSSAPSKFKVENVQDDFIEDHSESSQNRTHSFSKSDFEKPRSFTLLLSKNSSVNSGDISTGMHQTIESFVEHLKKHDSFFNYFHRNFRSKSFLLQNLLSISAVSKGLDFGSSKAKFSKETEHILMEHQGFSSKIFVLITNSIFCCKDEYHNPNHMNISRLVYLLILHDSFVGFSFPGFDSQVFHVGSFALVEACKMFHSDILREINYNQLEHNWASKNINFCFSDDQWTNLFGSQAIAKELMQVS
jgi:hypothetical protein